MINGSTDVLEYILSQEGCDVDPINRIEGATPLHLAVLLDHPGLRKHVVESLLDAGADTLCVPSASLYFPPYPSPSHPRFPLVT